MRHLLRKRVSEKGCFPFQDLPACLLGMCIFDKIMKRLMAIAGVLVAGFVLVAAKEAEPDKKEVFHLDGVAHRGKDTMTITITNTSPDGCDYLIAYGSAWVKSVSNVDSKNVLKIDVQPPISGNRYVCVAASGAKDHLLVGEQMMRLEFKIPDEYRSERMDLVDVRVRLCKTPILDKTIRLTETTVQLPVRVME